MEINVSVQYNEGLLPDIISLDCCLLLSICVAPVALAIVFMPGLYPTAYRATFPAFLCGWL